MQPRLKQFTAFLFVSGALLASSSAAADTVTLANGNKIDGSIVQDDRSSGGDLVLRIGDIGTMSFKAAEVAAVDVRAGDGPAEPEAAAADESYVEVRLSSGTTFYGSGSYFGVVSPASDDTHLVLAIPGAGAITIPRAAIASIDPVGKDSPHLPSIAGAAADDTAAPTTIDTTHAVYLKNGRKLIGTVLEGADDAPVKLRIGALGVVIIPRQDIARIEAESGVISIPAAPAPTSDAAPDVDVEALKETIKAELLRQLLEEFLDARIGALLEERSAIDPRRVTPLPAPLGVSHRAPSESDAGRIRHALRELTRQRTQNRVRAERHLRDMGAVVLPYVQSLVHHPFALTRRAVQRIVRDIGSVVGVPIAIQGLDDEDRFVRQYAHETLRALLPEVNVAYSSSAPPRRLAEAQAEYWAEWEARQLRTTEAALKERLSAAVLGERAEL